MPGRAPKPTRLKVIQGNPGKRELRKDEPKPAPKAPNAPTWLRREAAAEWRRVVPELETLGLIGKVDRAALAAYCEAWAAFHEASQRLKTQGVEIEVVKQRFFNELGEITHEEVDRIVNPALRHQRQALQALRGYLAEFGLSPAARTRLAVPDKDQGLDLAAILRPAASRSA